MSSSSSSSSSSSIDDVIETKVLFGSSIVQNHNAIIPFSCYGESGMADSSQIPFKVQASIATFDYSMILPTYSGNTITGQINNGVYVPEDETSQYQHDPMVYVDIMVKDVSGFKGYSLRSQVNKYSYENVTHSFNVPKFSWSMGIFGIEDSNALQVAENDPVIGSVWIGTDDNKIHYISYSANAASVTYYSNTASEVRNIVFNPINSETFISQYDHLSKYLIDSYYSEDGTQVEAEEELTINNSENDIMMAIHNGIIWSAQAYSGKIIARDSTTILPSIEYSGFDAPSKAVWSAYHNAMIVSGTNILWKLENGVKEAIYSISEFSINDFDVSPDGKIVIAFGGISYDILRVLSNDFYTILLNEKIEGAKASKCTYCEQGKFYMLVELNSGIGLYSSVHYLYDAKTNVLSKSEFSNDVVITATTTTQPIATEKVEIDFPSGGITWEIGSIQEIKWRSIASATDGVSIELFKNGIFVDTITPLTNNTGIFNWTISSEYESNSFYQIKITWLSSNSSSDNFDVSDNFVLTNIPQTTTTTTTDIVDRSIGISYNNYNGHVVVVLSNGLMGYFDIREKVFNGLFDTEISNATCIATKEDLVNKFSTFSKIRVFVGSQRYLSDKWDSGIIETDLNSIYYGGGNNLIPGERYYVNIQVYSENIGWSKVQTREWVMPK